MSLLISLQSEKIKNKRSASFYLCMIVAALVPIMLTIETITLNIQHPGQTEPWTNIFLEGREFISFMFLPLFIILVSTLLLQSEYRNNTWKQVLASPQELINIFFSKFIVLHLLIILFLLAYNFWLIVSAGILYLLIPDHFTGMIDLTEIFILNGQTYLSILGMSTIQFWLALRFRNFIASLAIGFCLWIATPMMLFEFDFTFLEYFPYSFYFMTNIPKYNDNIPFILSLSVAYAFVFLGIAFAEFKGRRKVN